MHADQHQMGAAETSCLKRSGTLQEIDLKVIDQIPLSRYLTLYSKVEMTFIQISH